MSRKCVLCGRDVPFMERVAVRANGTSEGALWVHQGCATYLAAGVLTALHGEEEKEVTSREDLDRRRRAAERIGLRPRERQVLQLMANGYTNRRIAEDLGLTVKTARNMVSSVLAKLDASNRAEAVAIATREGVLD